MIDLRQRVKTSCDVMVSDHILIIIIIIIIINFSAASSAATVPEQITVRLDVAFEAESRSYSMNISRGDGEY